MRLLLVTNDYPPKPGGIQQYLGSLVARFPGDVLVLGPRDPRAGERHGVLRGRRRFLWPTPAVLRWVEAAAAGFDPELVLFGAPYPLAWLGAALRRRLRVPYGVLAHGAEVAVPAALPLTRRLIAGPLRRADLVLTNSRHTTRVVERLLRRPAHYLGVGVDLEAFHPASRSRRARPVVGTVSRFVPRKGQADLIDAVAALRARGRDVEMLIVGRGRLERRLRRRAAALAVPVRFEIDVPWHRLPDLYRQMDVFAVPCRSRWMGLEAEGLGIVFLEAAASGLPVIAGDSGGAPETVEHGESGFVVRTRTELVEALELLVSDRVRAAAMGERGRARMRAEHSWNDVIERLVAGIDEARRSGGHNGLPTDGPRAMARPSMRVPRPRSIGSSLAVTGALALVTALASCSKPSLPGNLAVTDVVVGRTLAPDGTIAEDSRTNQYWTTDTFYVSVTTEGTAENVALQARWTGPNGTVAAESSKTISPRGATVTAFEAPPPADGRWPAGDYKVEILANGISQGSKDLNAR